VLQYVNRLSDFLFVAARHANDKGARDALWKPGENR
jgi:cob(I)alamin adenosyltransferase